MTRAGAAAQRDPAKLWDHLARRVVAGGDDSFEGQATLLLLAYAGSSDHSELPLDHVAAALTELCWRHSDGAPVRGYSLYQVPAYNVLMNVSDRPTSWAERHRISEGAATLARAALLHHH